MTMHVVSTDLGQVCEQRIRGIAGLAVRAGSALERWGRRLAAEPTREALVEHRRAEREARAGVQTRDALVHSVSRPMF